MAGPIEVLVKTELSLNSLKKKCYQFSNGPRCNYKDQTIGQNFDKIGLINVHSQKG